MDVLKTDIAIVGGGVIGLSIAWRLAAAGADVVVVDAGAAAPPASLAAAGMLAPSFELAGEADGGPLLDLSVESLEDWPGFARALQAATGQDVDLKLNGILGVAFDAAAARSLEARAAGMARAGREARLLDGRDARAAAPGLADGVVAGLFAPGEGQADPTRLLPALAAAAEAAGVRRARTHIARVKRSAAGYALLDGAGATVAAARRVVIATGAATVDLGDSPFPPVRPVKGEALALAPPAPDAPRPPHVIRSAHAYLCPKADGRVVVGATEIEGDTGLAPDPARIEALKAAAVEVFPPLADYAEADRWAGLRPGTPDGAPILGPAGEAPGLVFALGHHRNGILLAPATARRITAYLQGAEDAGLFAVFEPDRFAGGGAPARARRHG